MLPAALVSGSHQLNRQNLVEPDNCKQPYFDPSFQNGHGSRVLLIIRARNEAEMDVVVEKVRPEIGDAELEIVQVQHRSSLQQYNDMGLESLQLGMHDAIDCARRERQYQQGNIGTVIVAAVENYIRTSTRDSSGADFGAIMVCNTKTRRSAFGVSRGVPVQSEYLREARAGEHYHAGSEPAYSYLLRRFHAAAQKRRGSDFDIEDDWHLLVCGISRYDLPVECI